MLSRVSAPLDFLKIFADQMRRAGIPFAITSGMACVHYGLQQTTKDSDWIVPSDALERLRALFLEREGDLPPWRISYRQVFGAPLEPQFMQHGWSSHLSIWDGAASVEHKVDIFSKPPRVRADEIEADDAGWATRHVVAQMKRTDRDKDWPIVQGLGRQLQERNDPICLVHLTDADALLSAWRGATLEVRTRMAARRPLLRSLDATPTASRLELERLLALERSVWERVNRHRHEAYTRGWKEFFRHWRQEDEWEWPTSEPFWRQHRRLVDAAQRHGLPPDPLASLPPNRLVQAVLSEVTVLTRATKDELAQVLPPIEEMLP